MHTATEYVKYLFRSKSAHGIHSPFVFELYNKAIRNKSSWTYPISPENHRKNILSNNSTIQLKGFGAGSRINDSKSVIVKNHAKGSLKPLNECKLLYRIIKHLSPESVLELGTSFGVSTRYLSEAIPDGRITTLEGETEITSLAQSSPKPENIHFEQCDIDKWMNSNKMKFDCIIIDANHTYEATTDYYNVLSEHLTENGFIIFDDIYWSKGMTRAWNEIKQKKEVNVSIDLFHFGIIFLKPNQRKEHFDLRTFQLIH